MPRAVAVLLCKAVPRQAGWVALLLAAWVLLGGSRVAQAYPAPCSLEPHNQMYAQSTPFVTAPAFVAGCVGMVPGALLGGVVGLPFGHPDGGAIVGAFAFDRAFQAVVGLPFFVVEYVPRTLYAHWRSAGAAFAAGCQAAD